MRRLLAAWVTAAVLAAPISIAAAEHDGWFVRVCQVKAEASQIHPTFSGSREVEAMLQARAGPFAYQVIASDLEDRIAAQIWRAGASDLNPNILVAHGASIYAEILGVAEEAGADLIVVGSHRPAMWDYLLGTNASRVVRHANCSVLVARE